MNAPWRRTATPAPEASPSITEAEKAEDKRRRNREAQQRYRDANREKILAKQRECRAANPAKTRLQGQQSMKRWKERNPERAIAKQVLRYEAVGDHERAKARERARERRARDPEAVREADRQYQEQHRERIKAQRRARYERSKSVNAAHG
jgi:hypothetical protein